jgi:hypothetical protein
VVWRLCRLPFQRRHSLTRWRPTSRPAPGHQKTIRKIWTRISRGRPLPPLGSGDLVARESKTTVFAACQEDAADGGTLEGRPLRWAVSEEFVT